MKVNEVPVHSITESLHEGVSIKTDSSNSSSTNNEIIQVEEQNLIGSKQLGPEEQRKSINKRPLRRAAEVVTSYKEMSLK